MEEERPRVVVRPKAEEPPTREPAIQVQAKGEGPKPASRLDLILLLSVGLGGLLASAVTDWGLQPVLGVGACAIGLGCLLHVATTRPVFLLARRLAFESQRLRASLTCPYCRDDFPEAQAMACDRPGCGAFYHHECWSECSGAYGGCGAHGCGSPTAHEIGRLALQRRVIRLLVAAALFPPRAVQRLRDIEGKSLKAVYTEARDRGDAIARSPRQTFRVGIFAMACAFVVTMGVIAGSDPKWLVSDGFKYFIPIFFFVPAPFFAAPFFGYLFWGLLKLLARAFRGELGLLERADKGFLAKLAKAKPK